MNKEEIQREYHNLINHFKKCKMMPNQGMLICWTFIINMYDINFQHLPDLETIKEDFDNHFNQMIRMMKEKKNQ